MSGALEPLNLALMDLRFRLIERAPSDTLTVVEIDPYSLKEEGRWPWSRDRYATAIENLQSAGANLVAFDVDFSSLSDDAGDDAFVNALAQRPGEVVLPVFWQWSARSNQHGAMIQTPAHEKFLNDAVIASVTLTTEKNGVVRRGWRGVHDGSAFRASIAAVLAATPADAHETFYIDFGIDPAKIRRLSFHDVYKNDFPSDAVRGKNILIGATALELGDEFAAPVRGVTAGVLFHALGYESLLQNRDLQRSNTLIALVLALGIIIWTCRRERYQRVWVILLQQSLLFSLLIGVPIAIQSVSPMSVDAGAMIAAQLLCIIYVTGARLHRYARQILQQRAATAHYQALTGLVVRDNADGVIVADAQGIIELCNDRARELLRAADSFEAGSNICELAPDFPVHPATHKPQDETAQALNVQPVHVEYTANDGDGLTLEIVASCATSSAIDASTHNVQSQLFVYTLRDISARKRIEAAEREAKEAAIAANTMKSQLISNMSHELRTPLNGVIGFADILQKESFGPLGVAEYKDYSQSIYHSGKRLLGLVNDMLNIAKLDAKEFEISKSSAYLGEVIENCISLIEKRGDLKDKTISMKVQSGLPAVDIDCSVFNEILMHLVSNAVKYTSDDGKITIRAMQEDEDLIIEVEDNGCGVDPQCLPKLTQAFYQADAALNRQHEGAGLGLYLVTKFAALHHGVLEFENTQNARFLARVRFAKLIDVARASAA